MVIEIIPNWHPIFVHFTVGLLTTSTILFIIGIVFKSNSKIIFTVARFNLWIGAFITIGTLLAGWYAYSTVNHDGHSHLSMISHRNWAIPTGLAFIILALWSFFSRNKNPGKIFVICLIAATSALTVTAYKGGELVFRHGLGVMSMPSVVDDEPGHGHQDHHAH